MKWVEVYDIAIELDEKFPDTDPMTVSFPDLYEWVMALDGFDDDPNHCGEKVLEAIQMAWIEERQQNDLKKPAIAGFFLMLYGAVHWWVVSV